MTIPVSVILTTISHEIVSAGIFRSLVLALVDEPSHSIEVVRAFVHRFDADGVVVAGSDLRVQSDIIGLRYDLDDSGIMAEVAGTGNLIVTAGDDPRFEADRLGCGHAWVEGAVHTLDEKVLGDG